MNCALIFAGGTGQRMNTKTRPKQFLELHGKPIILYTIEVFENHPDIDAIVVVCLEDWIPFLEKKLVHYDIEKVVAVVPGGATGQESIRHGLDALAEHVDADATVLVHDGVRPLVSSETISDCLASVDEHGSAVTVTPAIETIVQEEDGQIVNIIERQACRMAKAPQCFPLDELLAAHRRAEEDGLGDFIDSASLMRHYGHPLHVVEGSPENIKITTPSDFYTFRAFVDARENSQIFGF
ncbi:2-C-methyl-D-erythritol 4-phosphate cytidylyltransferase [Adlercreutzia equolifaciens]|uniref:2-C-methyl-D-erythritol 4-phosphate cytidylyltransferase n=1 Tax=Adlercreutzia equolifaciens TaxID=446660 RepID=UPI0023AF8F07|nr:2-C-methyl-D-erythritol 4-phosphate cytidylyltransferase [Adlercreutzia equolifaciens]MDE8702803.1 2-C-methyl-D-erythritol 4-phosphate cytidylyltransferase [Adlercreutzia equolifaciens]